MTKVRIMPAIGSTTVSDNCLMSANTPAFHVAGEVPTCVATSPTCWFTSVNRPEKFPIIPSMSSPFSHSVIPSVSHPIGAHLKTGRTAAGSESYPKE